MTSPHTHLIGPIAAVSMLAATFALMPGLARAQSGSSLVLILDRDAIAPVTPPNSFTAVGVNATIAAVGVRDFLPAFTGRVGDHIVLPSGQVGYEGWFALKSTPSTWTPASGGIDGLQNLILAGAGLGSPDVNGSRVSLLDNVTSVTPLRALGLQMLIGHQVCALVFAGDIPWTTTTTSLKGATLGLVAFSVIGTSGGDGMTLPSIEVQLLDPDTTCGGALNLLTDAPQP